MSDQNETPSAEQILNNTAPPPVPPIPTAATVDLTSQQSQPEASGHPPEPEPTDPELKDAPPPESDDPYAHLPEGLPPVLDEQGNEIPPEKLPDLKPNEIIQEELMPDDEDEPADVKYFLEGLGQFRKWLCQQTAAEHPGRILAARIKLLTRALDDTIKTAQLTGLNK